MMRKLLIPFLTLLFVSCDNEEPNRVIDFDTSIIYSHHTGTTADGLNISFNLYDYRNDITEILIEDFQGSMDVSQWINQKYYYEQGQCVFVFDPKENTQTEVLCLEDKIQRLIVSTNETYIAILKVDDNNGYEGEIEILEIESGDQVTSFDKIYSIPVWSKDDQYVAQTRRINDDSTELIINNIISGNEIIVETIHNITNSINAISWYPSSELELIYGFDKKIIYNVKNGTKEEFDFLDTVLPVGEINYSHDGSLIAYALFLRSSPGLSVFDLDDKSRGNLGPSGQVEDFFWSSRDNKLVYNRLIDNDLYILDPEAETDLKIGKMSVSEGYARLQNWLN